MTRLIAAAMFALAGAALAAQVQPPPVPQPPIPPATCARIASLALPETVIAHTEVVDGSSFTPPAGRTLGNLPPFCRVAATTEPAVRFEVWLPLANWNGKFQGVGNGANAGQISYDAMAAAVRRGYAVASTDTGHATTNGRDARWALGHPNLVLDFAYRGLHLTTTNAKAVVRAFYGESAKYSYYVGCSTGGRQGLMEAQRYPDDYDGLVTGAPAANWTRFQTGGHLWAVLALNKDPESYLPASKLPLIEKAVNASCDAADGIADGVLDDPRQCRFDAQALACKAGQDPSQCLTPKQAKAVNDIWSGPRNSRGEQVYPPYMRGAEAAGGWASYSTGKGPLSGNHWEQAENTLKYMVFENPSWDFRTFDYDRDVPIADARLAATMNAFDPDLAPLRKRGGRLLMYHGWNDPSISPQNTVNYYESAVATWRAQEKAGAEATPDFIRLFMVPGMLHCSGGPGTDTFDALAALERWVERGDAPDSLPASHVTAGVVTRTRPLCAYPKVAVYNGQGSTDQAENFTCRTPDSR
ncbi:MAG TPA: tannase/feruloyl esterase family alpha/beta hydrolase [Vicinamibacterales bacterium]|nr:tannase/feruloyl esterase family alpha/beta hydrolase [Vicinamibacterales bacterium]